MWAIYHRGDNRWVCAETRILRYINKLPLVTLELGHPAVTLPEFLFHTKKAARTAALRLNRNPSN